MLTPAGDACLGGTAYGDDSCAVGHEGPRCQVCSERYYHDSGDVWGSQSALNIGALPGNDPLEEGK